MGIQKFPELLLVGSLLGFGTAMYPGVVQDMCHGIVGGSVSWFLPLVSQNGHSLSYYRTQIKENYTGLLLIPWAPTMNQESLILARH